MGSFKLVYLNMKTTILILLLSLGMKGQTFKDFSNNHNDVVHFYAAFSVNLTSYHSLSYACPKWKPAKKILVANLITLAAIFGKEFYDTKKPNKTGFSWDDAGIGCWSIPIYDAINICKRDYVGHDVGDAYVKRIEILDSLEPAPKKWSLKRNGFLN
jgi:hypothetical protein